LGFFAGDIKREKRKVNGLKKKNKLMNVRFKHSNHDIILQSFDSADN
jgi:hypothetical protein